MYKLIDLNTGSLLCTIVDVSGRNMPNINVGDSIQVCGCDYTVSNKRHNINITNLDRKEARMDSTTLFMKRESTF